MTLYGLVGAGGFGREVMPLAAEQLRRAHPSGGYELVFVVESGAAGPVNGHRVLSAEEFLASGPKPRFNIAIADHAPRKRIAEAFLARGAEPYSIRAANVVDLSHNSVGAGEILCPFVTLTANATIGRFFHANLYSYVAHDCRIGDFVTFAPNVCCNGRVTIEDHAYIGTGAVLRQGSDERPIVIGRGAVVGMGAVVTKSVESNTTVVGNPAAPLQRQSR